MLMETGEVTVGTGRTGFRGQIEVFTMAAPREFYSDTVQTIAINARETEFGSTVEPIPVTLTYKQLQSHAHNGYGFPANGVINSFMTAPRLPEYGPTTSYVNPSPVKVKDTSKLTRAPPKKKWIREYLGEFSNAYLPYLYT